MRRTSTVYQRLILCCFAISFSLVFRFSEAAETYIYPTGGVWLLYQPTGSSAAAMITDLNNKKAQIQNALTANAGIVGFSCRVPWRYCDNGDFSVFNRAAEIAHEVNKLISIRFMAGKHTPARVLNRADCYSVMLGADRVPVPMNPANGTAGNPGFEAEYGAMIASLQAWCVAHDCGLLHLPWYGHLWAELKGDSELQTAIDGVGGAGTFTAARWRDGHLRLIEAAFANTAAPVAIEYAGSGHVELVGSVTGALWDSLRSHTGMDWSPRAYVQTNNIGGQWGIAGNPGGGRKVRKAGQMVGSGNQIAFGWPEMFDALRRWGGTEANAEPGDCRYLEVYLPSFANDDPAVLKAEALDWYDEVYEGEEPPPPPPPDPSTVTETWEFRDTGDWTVTRIDSATTVEAIKTMSPTEGTGFAWGGRTAAGGGILLNNTTGKSLIFKTIPSDGTYAYTRFGTGAAAAAPTKIVDASADGSRIDLVADQQSGGSNLVGTVEVSVLIRDNTGWFVSSSKSVPAVTAPTTYTYVLKGTGAVTWNSVSQAASPADIDQVDGDGEQALVVGAAGTPDLSKIEGMGVMLRSTATSGDLRFSSISLAPAKTDSSARLRGYE